MRESCAFERRSRMRFRDVGVQLEYDGDFKIYREDGISRYGKPDYLFLYFHTELAVY